MVCKRAAIEEQLQDEWAGFPSFNATGSGEVKEAGDADVEGEDDEWTGFPSFDARGSRQVEKEVGRQPSRSPLRPLASEDEDDTTVDAELVEPVSKSSGKVGDKPGTRKRKFAVVASSSDESRAASVEGRVEKSVVNPPMTKKTGKDGPGVGSGQVSFGPSCFKCTTTIFFQCDRGAKRGTACHVKDGLGLARRAPGPTSRADGEESRWRYRIRWIEERVGSLGRRT